VTFHEFESYDAVGLAGLIRSGELSVKEVVAAAIERIERHNPSVNAVVTKTYNRGLALADQGVPDGPLAGVPFLLKDLSAEWKGVPSTEGSRSLQWYVPATTSTLVGRYERAGLVILGKTNVPEFGLAPVTECELHGTANNPWDLTLTPGGSSGGSAAAVAAGMVPVAHASDGGGSIRIPASHTGLFGLKPTKGRTPSGPDRAEGWYGMSTAHVVTRSVRDSAALLDATHGPEVGDRSGVAPPERPFLEEVGAPTGRLRVGVVNGGVLHDDIDAECRAAVSETADLLHDLGHQVEGVELPVDRTAWKNAFLVMVAASTTQVIQWAAQLQGVAKPDPSQYELPTWILGLVGRQLGAVDFADAYLTLGSTARAMGRVMEQFDVVVSSTMAKPPWPHGALQPTGAERRVLEGLRRAPAKPALMLAFRQLVDKVMHPIPNTLVFNMTGQPAMSVPLHWTSEGLPVGVQFAARFGDEATLFRLAGQLEEARPWFDRRAPTFE
jgi:amidase